MGGSRRCVVPSCRHLSRSNAPDRRSMFQVPKDEERARRWAELIRAGPLTNYMTVCDRHFEPRFINRYFEKNSTVSRCRLSNDAIPTIFYDNNTNYNQTPDIFSNITYQLPNDINNQIAQFFDNNTSNHEMSSTFLDSNLINHETSNTLLDNNLSNHQVQSTSGEASLQDIVKDLSASEKLLIDIKQEMFPISEDGTSRVKLENTEVKMETDDMKELSAYEQIQRNFSYYITQLPESWNLTRLPIGTDQVFAFSKECTVTENQALMVMNEKSIVINKSGNVHYSIHGKMLNTSETYPPSIIQDISSLLDVILKFDEMKVCQGIRTNEFEVDKDCIVYKDDLGYCRHVNCSLIADKEQCDFCWGYSQYLLAIMVNNTPVLSNEPVCFYDQIY